MKTKTEIVAWLKGGWKKDPKVTRIKGKLGIDTDGQYGHQCKDYANAYARWQGHPLTAGNAHTAWTEKQDPFWLKRGVTRKAVTGDIAVFKPAKSNGLGGHIGVVLHGGILSFQSMDQNWFNANLAVGSPPALVKHWKWQGLFGFLRPPLKKGK